MNRCIAIDSCLLAGTAAAEAKDLATDTADAPSHAQNDDNDGLVKPSALNIFAPDHNTTGRLVAGNRVFVTKRRSRRPVLC